MDERNEPTTCIIHESCEYEKKYRDQKVLYDALQKDHEVVINQLNEFEKASDDETLDSESKKVLLAEKVKVEHNNRIIKKELSSLKLRLEEFKERDRLNIKKIDDLEDKYSNFETEYELDEKIINKKQELVLLRRKHTGLTLTCAKLNKKKVCDTNDINILRTEYNSLLVKHKQLKKDLFKSRLGAIKKISFASKIKQAFKKNKKELKVK